MIEITSRDNPKLKRIRKIREGRETGFIFIEGARLAAEALRSPVTVTDAVFAKTFADRAAFENLTSQIVVPDAVFDSIADTKNSQGVALIAARPESSEVSFRSRFTGPNAVMLHRVNNPSNLGGVLRTCEAAGVADVILTRDSADAFSPKALRASMGSALRLNIWEGADFGEALEWARSVNLTATAADISGNVSYRTIDWAKPRFIVFGSEANGLAADELARMDEIVVIPMRNGVESLNLAVSAGILLFALA